MPSAPLLVSQAFNGLALGTLLALVSSGLTIILGTLGVLNFAHGALFMVGSYPGAVVGGIIAGEIISITSAFNSAYSEVMLYAVMALLLVLRPQGLFGSEGRV